MRRVDRSLVPVPKSLKGTFCRGTRELVAARAHYASGNTKAFKFSVYKRKDVVDALETLFHGKCAYCESTYGHIGPVDVEHFRPKGLVAEEPTHQGYWWLAATWQNLLPSCIDCNRRRKHLHQTIVPPSATPRLQCTGKHNAFPLVNPGNRAMSRSANLAAEDPLLIDPTSRDPDLHLRWILDTPLSIVAPVNDVSGNADGYGAVSIKSYGLNRQKLVEERTKLKRQLDTDAEDIRFLLSEASSTELPRGKRWIDRAILKIKEMQKRSEASEIYAAYAGKYIDQFLDQLEGEFSTLLAFTVVR